MPVFTWGCPSCKKLTRKLSPARPKLEACGCGGQPEFISGTTTKVVEVRDNGLMPKKVEQLADIQELIKNRNPDDST